ncbi:LysR family hydrogen peroxide-inducible transcriptional activator [Amaricoccus macauensis]|uniref:LysR family hydrogen peroxide-inducible transcriptional activator n=1 Tax=Amaricoccus macauensis TaxID=57001 RepID=A0A840SFU8_9RHOB|nr:hydrogen peroxide-inducible genes activator [Amaricoccus macauensis]MBB5220737.1 LysR family hydrogen peroxide-inducible transcriptional activator [Amaricoccus macauensis]
MSFTLRQLRSLTALAEEGHFGRAAAAVNISQPALSVQIRELEATLGARLVERGPREAVLTPTGREIVRRARRIFEEVREIEQVARWHGGLSGRLRIGVIPTVAPYLLPLALPELRARNISLDLGVREAQTERLIDEVRSGGLDAAVMALPVEAADLVAEPLFEDRFLLAGTGSRLAALGAEPAPEAMEPGQLLLLDDGHCLADQAIAACAVDRSRAPMDLRAASLSTLCRLVSEGFGVTLLPELAASAESAAAPGLALTRFAEPEPRRTIGLVRRRLSVDDGWFGELGRIFGEAGRQVIAGWTGPSHEAPSGLPVANSR